MVIFSEFVFYNFNSLIFDATFSTELKNVDVIPLLKRKTGVTNNSWEYVFFSK